MLTATFCHLPGIGHERERRLWEQGVLSWDTPGGSLPVETARRLPRKALQALPASQAALATGDLPYFLRALPPRERARVLPHAAGRIAYVDIETTGGGADSNITCIALYDGHTVRSYVAGENLDDYARDIEACDLVVTYNGARFDMPILIGRFGARVDRPHLDLCPVLHGFGYYGGLKRIERNLNVPRQVPHDLDGYDAVLLWRLWRYRGALPALELLRAYNAADVLSLEALLCMAYNRAMERFPGFVPRPLPRQPTLRGDPRFRLEPDDETAEALAVAHASRGEYGA